MVLPALLLAFGAVGAFDPVVPSSPDVKNVVFTLVRGGKNDGALFTERNRCLRRVLRGEPYDQVVFHEGDLKEEAEGWAAAKAAGIRFVDVGAAFTTPTDVDIPEAVLKGTGENSLGYRHMVRAPRHVAPASAPPGPDPRARARPLSRQLPRQPPRPPAAASLSRPRARSVVPPSRPR